MSEGWLGDDKGMVNDVEGMYSLGGKEMLSSMRDEICVCVAVVVVLMVGMGVVVLMVGVGVKALMVGLGVVVLVGVLYIGAMEVDCL